MQVGGIWSDAYKVAEGASRCHRTLLFSKHVAVRRSSSWLANITSIFKKDEEDPGDCRPVKLTSSAGGFLEWILLKAISKHLKVIGKSVWIYRCKSCLTNLIAFSGELTDSALFNVFLIMSLMRHNTPSKISWMVANWGEGSYLGWPWQGGELNWQKPPEAE